MRAVTPCAAPPDAAAEAAFAEARAYLSSHEAQQMSESELERALYRRGQELMRKLLQRHSDQRSPGEAVGPVEGADGVERSERRVHERHLETIFGCRRIHDQAVRAEPGGVPSELDAPTAGGQDLGQDPGRAASPRGETGLGRSSTSWKRAPPPTAWTSRW